MSREEMAVSGICCATKCDNKATTFHFQMCFKHWLTFGKGMDEHFNKQKPYTNFALKDLICTKPCSEENPVRFCVSMCTEHWGSFCRYVHPYSP